MDEEPERWCCAQCAQRYDATLAERKRIVALLRKRQRAASARWARHEATGQQGHVPAIIAGAHEYAYGEAADGIEQGEP